MNFEPVNQCVMCCTLNPPTRKSCSHCKCRKYLRACRPPSWTKGYHSYWFDSGKPRGHSTLFELEYWNNTYRQGWTIFRNEEFTPFTNKEIDKKDYLGAQVWATKIIEENYE